jgi:Subtilase family
MPRSFHKTPVLALLTFLVVGAGAYGHDGNTPEVRDDHQVRDLERTQERATRDLVRGESSHSGSGGSRSGGSGDGKSDGRSDSRSDGNSSESSKTSDDSGKRDARARAARVDVERSRGGDRQRDEVLMIGSDAAVASARGAGLTVLSERRLESLAQSMVRIQVRSGESVEKLIETLRTLAPEAHVAPNHVFRPSQASGGQSSMGKTSSGQSVAAPRSADIGVIDTGADLQIPLLSRAVAYTKGLAAGGYQARAHGSAVAQLAALEGASLAIVDVFGLDKHNQLVASAEMISAGVDFLRSRNVGIINISVEGPDNLVLAFVIEAAVKNGVAIIAAAGNGGPAAPAAFPAAYPGVIAVTALDERGQVYRRATRGSYIYFAARGVYPADHSPIQNQEFLAGTSFAAPAVASQLAFLHARRPEAPLGDLINLMRLSATDLGAPGRDAIYGWGKIAANPDAMRWQVSR